MAIIIGGKTECGFCGAVIEGGQKAASFGSFVSNELDPLSLFNDGAFHMDCFRNHPLAEKAEERWAELQQRLGPGNRVCVVCDKKIEDPDEYFTLWHLIDDPAAPLYEYNYTQAHSSCLPHWSELRKVYKLLKDLQSSKSWRGKVLEKILPELEGAMRNSGDDSNSAM
jgi:hypothetical protein